MTAQSHIDMIGRAQTKLERLVDTAHDLAKRTAEAAKAAEVQAKVLHSLMDKAQKAFKEQYPEPNVVLFSGGTDKPPQTPPDEPLDPIP